jgi:hypothetical protein
MTYTNAKLISESYAGAKVTFDNTTGAAVAKGFTSTNVQDAIVEAKYIPVYASTTVAGLVRKATDSESILSWAVNAYVTPDQVYANIVKFWNVTIQPSIPPAVTLPRWIYGGTGPLAQMVSTYTGVPVGSVIVFEDQYNYVHGWGNGSSTLTAWVRRTMILTENGGWRDLNFWTLPT